MNRLALPLTLLLAAPALAQTNPKPPLDRFQEAVTLEEQRGQLAAAAAAYETLAEDPATPSGLEARCWYRRGVCLESLGRRADARAAYQRVVKGFAAQAKLVQRARAALKRLTPRPPQANRPRLSVTPAANGAVTIDAKNANIRDLIEQVAQRGKLDYAISPEVAGSVTLQLTAIQPLAALRLILHSAGDFELAKHPTHPYVRVSTRSSFEQDLRTRVYPLKPSTPATESARRGLLTSVRELIRSHRVVGTTALYDRRSASLVVRHSLPGHAAVAAVVGKALRPTQPRPAPAGVRVSLDLRDAHVGTALRVIAATAGTPLLVSPEVSGNITLRFKDAPLRLVLEEVAKTCGDYEVFETPAATVVMARSSSEAWLTVERWPLQVKPRAFWTVAEALPIPRSRTELPRHPLHRFAADWVSATRVLGAFVGHDVGGHALLLQLTPPLRAELRRVLAGLGYVAADPARPAAKRLQKLEDVDLRTALNDVAQAAGAGLVIAPQVRGRVSGTYRADADPADVLRTLLRISGDYALAKVGPKLYRATTRSATESQLQTARVTLRKRSASSTRSLRRPLAGLVNATRIVGALAVLDAANRAFVLSLPPRLLNTARSLIAASDQPGIEPQLEGLVLPTFAKATQEGMAPGFELYWIEAGRPRTSQAWVTNPKWGTARQHAGKYYASLEVTGTGRAVRGTLRCWIEDRAPTTRRVWFPEAAFFKAPGARKRRPRRVSGDR